MRDIGKNIKLIREKKSMTQEALAEALYVTRQTVSNYETGKTRPDIDMLLKISEVLETDIQILLYGEPVPESRKKELRRLAFCGGWVLVMAVLYFTLRPVVNYQLYNMFNSGPRWLMLNLTPSLLALPLGWCLMQAVSLLSGAKPLRQSWVPAARRILLGLLIVLELLMLPGLIYHMVLWVRRMLQITGYTSLDLGRFWNRILMELEIFRFHHPFFHVLPGIALWLLGFPAARREKPSSPAD